MDSTLPHAVEQGPSEAVLDPREILDFFVRHWKFIASVTALIAAATLFILFTITPRYTGTAQILLGNQRENVLGQDSIVSDLTFDSSFVDSQVAVLRSRSLLHRVVTDMNLAKDREFGRRAEEKGLFATLRGRLFGGAGANAAEEEQASDAISPAVLASIAILRDSLDIEREGRSYVIGVSVTSEDPQKAAALANAVADAFIVDQLEAGYEAAQRAASWLGDRIEKLRAELLASENAVEEFRVEHNLVATSTGTLNEQQLSELNAQLVAARADLAEKRAKYEQAAQIQAQGGDMQAAPDVLLSPVVAALREQFAEVSSREADLIARYGGRHPLVVNVGAERGDVERQIAAEVDRIVANLRNDLAVAESRETSLRQSLGVLTGETGVDNKVAVRLRELERIAAANKALYESFLSRAKVAEEQTTLANRDARVISTATAPGGPSFPRKKLVMALALVMGVGLGTGGAFLLDVLNSGFMTPRQIEEMLELPVLASVPLMRSDELTVNGEELPPPRYLVQKPLSRYSEAVRALRSAVQMSDVDRPPQLIQVTSAMPGEGKTTLAMSMAFSLRTAGHTVLLLDADLRHPSVSNVFGLVDQPGLVDLLVAGAPDASRVRPFREPESGVEILPAGSKTHNPPDLLASDRMKGLIASLRERYEYILVDSPPVAPVIDATVLSRQADKVVFAVKWGSTPREAVANAVRQISGTRKIAGIALNQVDERQTPKYGRYAYHGSSYYGSYYSQ